MKVKLRPLQKKVTTACLIFVYHVTGKVRVHQSFGFLLRASTQLWQAKARLYS